MKAEFWAADTFRFSVTGPGTFRFLNRAAASGVRLRRVRWQKDGYTATASGPDRRRLEEIAKSGGWAFTVTARRGPGRRTEWLLRTRPGMAAGAVLFFVLLCFLGGFVWCIDYGAMDTDLHAGVRTLLADCGIHEGVYLTKPLLQAAQAQALRRSETFGWVSLNFTGGCLSVESTPVQTQTVRDPPPRQGLYAAADGKVLAVEIESGFAVVASGGAGHGGPAPCGGGKARPQGQRRTPRGHGGALWRGCKNNTPPPRRWNTRLLSTPAAAVRRKRSTCPVMLTPGPPKRRWPARNRPSGFRCGWAAWRCPPVSAA